MPGESDSSGSENSQDEAFKKAKAQKTMLQRRSSIASSKSGISTHQSVG